MNAKSYDASAGNQPYLVKGISIPDSLSFYYFSQYRLTEPGTHVVRTCTDGSSRAMSSRSSLSRAPPRAAAKSNACRSSCTRRTS